MDNQRNNPIVPERDDNLGRSSNGSQAEPYKSRESSKPKGGFLFLEVYFCAGSYGNACCFMVWLAAISAIFSNYSSVLKC